MDNILCPVGAEIRTFVPVQTDARAFIFGTVRIRDGLFFAIRQGDERMSMRIFETGFERGD
jgi:hypothetical protein